MAAAKNACLAAASAPAQTSGCAKIVQWAAISRKDSACSVKKAVLNVTPPATASDVLGDLNLPMATVPTSALAPV